MISPVRLFLCALIAILEIVKFGGSSGQKSWVALNAPVAIKLVPELFAIQGCVTLFLLCFLDLYLWNSGRDAWAACCPCAPARRSGRVMGSSRWLWWLGSCSQRLSSVGMWIGADPQWTYPCTSVTLEARRVWSFASYSHRLMHLILA